MARQEIRPLEALDRTATVVGTDALHRQGVQRLRVLSESRFLDMVRRLVEESLTDRLSEVVPAAPADAADETPLDRQLRKEYQRRWEALKARHGAELQQVERRIDRLSRSLREIDHALRDLRQPQAGVEVDGADAEPGRGAGAPTRSALLREMLLGEAD